jgi:hypothetical protein
MGRSLANLHGFQAKEHEKSSRNSSRELELRIHEQLKCLEKNANLQRRIAPDATTGRVGNSLIHNPVD